MKMEKTFVIRNWKTGKHIFSFKCLSLKIALEVGIALGVCFDYAELNDAELNDAELNDAELNYAKLNHAKLNHAKLNRAKLNYAKLNYAKLNYAELNDAELNYADIDFSSLPMWCGSLSMKTCGRIRKQVAFHFLSLIKYSENATEEELAIFELLKDYANGFHRSEEVGLL